MENGTIKDEEIKVTIKEIKEVQSLASRNEFERQIFASFPLACSAFRITEYQIEDAIPLVNVFTGKKKKHNKGTIFETDLYVKLEGAAENVTLGDFLRNVVEIGYCVLPVEDCEWKSTPVSNKWVFAEITEKPEKLFDKAWQLERSFRLIKNCDVAAVVLLVNGEENEFHRQAKALRDHVHSIREDLHIKRTVFVVGYTPNRSVYLEMNNLKKEMTDLKTDLKHEMTDLKDEMTVKVNDLSSNVKEVLHLLQLMKKDDS